MKPQLTFVAVLFLAACLESYGVNADEIVREECLKPKDSGSCSGNSERYYYDAAEKQCKQFMYKGCDGNENKFQTARSCQEFCQTPREKLCKLPKKIGHPMGKVLRYYYNAAEQLCLPFRFAGYKGNANNFRTYEACRNFCQGV